MRNSIEYPGERAPRRPAVIAQAGYTGQNHFSVTYGDQKVTVRAEDGYAALFTAAKHWGYKFTRPEYHQTARATKLHYTPDTRPGAAGLRGGSRPDHAGKAPGREEKP